MLYHIYCNLSGSLLYTTLKGIFSEEHNFSDEPCQVDTVLPLQVECVNFPYNIAQTRLQVHSSYITVTS